jgi:subtilisin-like proprotein convertase family protein
VNGRLGFGNETVLVANDNGASDDIPSEAFVGTVADPGVYNLLVDANGAAAGESGTYLLSVTVIRAVERGCRTYASSPGAIADRDATTFPIDVPDGGRIDHVAVRLDLNHTFMSDLDATLEAPAGNRAVLFDDIGNSNVGSSNTRMLTLFDENAGMPPIYTWLKGMSLQPKRGGLSYFAGQPAAGTWKLTLRDDATDDVGELAHADLILCTRPEEGPVDTVFSAGFESGDDGFTHSGAADEWERGTPATAEGTHLAGLTGCAEGTGCFKTDLDGTYEASSSQDLVSPPISLEGRTGEMYASWQMWYQLESAHFEHLTVSVEEDGGANARPLFTWAGADMVASHGNPVVQLGLAAGWGRHRADVSDYAGKTIRLRFHLDSDNNVQRRGVAIDDVRVYQQVAVAAGDTPPPASPPAEVAPVTVAEGSAISDLRLGARCVRRSSTGRVRVPMAMRLAQPGAIQVGVERAVGSKGRRSCPRANPRRNERFRGVAEFRPVATARAAAAVTRRVTLDLRLRPGLYRLKVRVQLEDGRLSPPVRRFLRVLG